MNTAGRRCGVLRKTGRSNVNATSAIEGLMANWLLAVIRDSTHLYRLRMSACGGLRICLSRWWNWIYKLLLAIGEQNRGQLRPRLFVMPAGYHVTMLVPFS